ncbi:MAG TPA: zincin-like metallopeptidase domain-containing protein [Candidatus Thermoplasmatota archaeon]|nr:zincin-like metallopeptidase domain-containing protein [Candidatus Thermoplasmatota archaeon]
MKRDVYEEVSGRMIDALETGIVPWRKPWTTMGAHRNLITGRDYRGINVFLTALSAMKGGYSYPMWVTMKQANKLGGRVRAGERGTMVVFWEPRVDVRKNATGEDEEHRRLVFKKYYVWNVEQVDGIILPEIPKPSGAAAHDGAEAAWEGYAGRPALFHGGSAAFYTAGLDAIQMPPRSAFEGTSAYYQVLFHESIHSTGAKSRLNRSTLTQAGRFGDANYSQEELVAERGGAMLLARAGLEPAYENSAAYLRGWLKALNNDKRLVVVAAQQAEKAARYVLGERAPLPSEAGETSEAIA